MVRRGCRVGQCCVSLALQKQPVRFGPTGCDSHDVIGQVSPNLTCVITIGRLNPHQQAKARCGRSWILDHDLDVAVGQRAQRFWRIRTGISDKGKVTPVERKEFSVVPCNRQSQISGDPMRGKQTRSTGCGCQVCIQAQNDVGLGPWTFKLKTRQKSSTIASTHKLQITGAGIFKCSLHRRAWAPFAGKTVVCHNCQYRGLGSGSSRHAKSRDSRQNDWFHHHILQMRRADWGTAELLDLPSAGLNRFRFDGYAFLHLSLVRPPEVGLR